MTVSVRTPETSWSAVTYLAEDGTVLGSYELFDENGNDLGVHWFRWSMADGFSDLGALVDGGLETNGW